MLNSIAKRQTVAAVLAFALTLQSSFAIAQVPTDIAPSQRAQNLQFSLPRGAEYSAGTYPGEVLLPTYLIGAVARPGIYNLPKKTDILHLLTLAGGVTNIADTTTITVKRRINSEEKIYRLELEAILMTTAKETLYLEAGDVIYIPLKEPLIDPATSSLIAFVASILGVITTAIVLSSSLAKD